MSNARDELAGLLFTTDNSKAVSPWSEWEHSKRHPRLSEYVYAMADAVLAAGYRKPRTITTAEELDALPHAAVILDALNYCREAAKVSDGNIWRAMGPTTVRASREIALPATVLYEPEARP